jgi:hypothetical protein
MIISRYRYHSVTVTALPLRTVYHCYRTLPTVTDCYQTESNRCLRYKRYINFFYKTVNICSKGPILPSLTLETAKFGNGL